MNYKALFGDRYWRERIITNYIYELLDNKLDSQQETQVVERANKMKTTLWFSDEQKQSVPTMLDALIESGRVTMKYKLGKKEVQE